MAECIRDCVQYWTVHRDATHRDQNLLDGTVSPFLRTKLATPISLKNRASHRDAEGAEHKTDSSGHQEHWKYATTRDE